jgi:hypothetical protein
MEESGPVAKLAGGAGQALQKRDNVAGVGVAPVHPELHARIRAQRRQLGYSRPWRW